MADLKISQLTNATLPLAGTEVLPIVQTGTTKQVSIPNLTTGRAVTTNGIAFPATQVPSADPNTLDDYEEGTWTATLTGSTTPPTTPIQVSSVYTKIGRQVTVQARFNNVDTTGAAGNLLITGLPFTSSPTFFVGSAIQSGFGTNVSLPLITNASARIDMTATIGGGATAMVAGTGKYLYLTVTYFV